MGSHRPRHPRRGRDGHHTSLVGGPEYDVAPAESSPGAGGPDVWDPAYGETRTSLVGGTGYDSGPAGGGYGTTSPEGGYGTGPAPGGGGPGGTAPGAWDAAYGEARTSLVGGYAGDAGPAYPQGERYVEGDWPRVWHGEYRPAGHAEDTVVLGDFGLFDNSRPPGTGAPPASEEAGGQPPGRAWYRQPRRLAAAAGGLALVAFAGFLVVPAILSHLGIGGTAPHSALCPACQFPIPSSSPVPPTPAAPTTSAPRPRHSRAPVAATQPAAPVQNHGRTAAPTQTATGLAVYYSETPQGGGAFLAHVTVVNHDPAAVSGWQLVVALPYDNVSEVTNARGYDEDDVLFLQPASSDPSIPPGGTLVVTIAASGPTTIPDDCSFNNVACR
jgi:hypothetical protein